MRKSHLRLMLAVVLAAAGQRLAGSTAVPLGLDLFMPVPASNPMTAVKIEWGRRLFSDRRLSRDESVSCASCHDASRAFSDGDRISTGAFGRTGRRNAPAIINRGYGRAFFWDGRVASLEEQVLMPIQDPNEMDLSLYEAEARVAASRDDISRALASYVRSILSGNSAFDLFVSGERTALTDEQQRGLQIFRGKGRCTTCHIGPNFSDEQLHNTGVAWNGERFTDRGAGAGDFKTPTLREIARTAPYMHDGSLATLEDVIDFYDRGGNSNPDLAREMQPLHLTAGEKRALLSFLGALSGDVASGVRSSLDHDYERMTNHRLPWAPPETHGMSSAPPAGRAEVRLLRSPPAWSRWQAAAMAVDRFEFPHPAAASSV